MKARKSEHSKKLTNGQQGPRAKYMLYPYYALLITTTAGKKDRICLGRSLEVLTWIAASQYMMIRMVLGHKTWFGSS